MRRKKRKTDIIAAVLLIALAAGTVAVWFTGAVDGTLAAFYSAGDPVLIEAGLASPGTAVGAENWGPGDESRVSYTVQNVSDYEVNVSVELKCKWENGLPDDNVSIAVVGSNGNRWLQDSSNPKIYHYDRPFTGTIELYLSVKLLGQQTGNMYQGQTYVLSPTFRATAEEPSPPVETEEYGTLYVTKFVEGDKAPSEDFSFVVQFTGSSLGTIRFNGNNSPDGKYELTLSAGKTASFTNITPGTSYVISEKLSKEQDDNGWDAPADKSGDIKAAGEVDTVTVTNVYDASVLGATDEPTNTETPDVEPPGVETPEDDTQVAGDVVILPQTGGISGTTILALVGTALTLTGTVAYLIVRKRRRS
jgi:LPXTG-motif cell wall-anchored protein